MRDANPQRPSRAASNSQPVPSLHPRGSEWQQLVDQQIEEAMRSGAFDNLPGTGKPLNLDTNPFAPPDMEMANKLLLDNDLSPAWIADRNDLLAKIAAWRTQLRQGWSWTQEQVISAATNMDRLAAAKSWTRQVGEWEQQVAALNRQIRTVNLTVPIVQLEILQLRLDDELRRAGASRSLALPE